jgi:hypothetical protein
MASLLDDMRHRSESARERLVVVGMAPSLAGADVFVPGTGPDVEAALAELLFRLPA